MAGVFCLYEEYAEGVGVGVFGGGGQKYWVVVDEGFSSLEGNTGENVSELGS